MIEQVTAYRSEDGKTHASLQDAVRHELSLWVEEQSESSGPPPSSLMHIFVKNPDEAIQILRQIANGDWKSKREWHNSLSGPSVHRDVKPKK